MGNMNSMRSQLRHSNPAITGRRTKPIISKDYIVGLTDGEGCFYVLVRKSSNYRAGAMVELRFHIKMQAEEKPLLEKVKNTLACGQVYFQPEKRRNHTQCYRYTVNSHDDILTKIIPFFRQYPLRSFSKQRSFKIFCKIAEIVRQKQHLTKPGIAKIRQLKTNLNKKYRARVVREIRTLRGNTK